MYMLKDGEKGGREVGGGEIIYLSLHCYHQNNTCIKMGSDESHFNVSLIVRDKVTRQCPQTTTFEEKGEPKRIRTEVPLLTSVRIRTTYQPKRLTARPNRPFYAQSASSVISRRNPACNEYSRRLAQSQNHCPNDKTLHTAVGQNIKRSILFCF